MAIFRASGRRLAGAALVGLMLSVLGFGDSVAQASPPVAPLDDPSPTGPDPGTLINDANTILPVIGRFAQYLPSFLDPGAAVPDPPDAGTLQPPMLGPFVPGS